MASDVYPVHLKGEIDEPSRALWLVKCWLLAIPHYFVLCFLIIAFSILTIIAFFSVLFTGRYPRGIFNFNVGVLIAYVSSIMTLEPGDLLFTGTPAGVGELKDGDVVDVDEQPRRGIPAVHAAEPRAGVGLYPAQRNADQDGHAEVDARDGGVVLAQSIEV